MVHGHEESDSAIVAAKPANKVERSAAELVEPRAETKGNVDQQSTRRTQCRISVSQALDRIRLIVAVTHPRWEPSDLGGGRSVMSVPTAKWRPASWCDPAEVLERNKRT
jgi:hypothetical protein